jgi:hypothetical protein
MAYTVAPNGSIIKFKKDAEPADYWPLKLTELSYFSPAVTPVLAILTNIRTEERIEIPIADFSDGTTAYTTEDDIVTYLGTILE